MKKKPRAVATQVTTTKLKAINKRWPERFAMRVFLYRKHEKGLYHMIETDLTDEEFSTYNAWMGEVFRRAARDSAEYAQVDVVDACREVKT